MEIKRIDKQSIFDIALQYAGSIEAVFDIARLNDIQMPFDDSFNEYKVIRFKSSMIRNKQIVDYFRNTPIATLPNSNVEEDDSEMHLCSQNNEAITTQNGEEILIQ